MIKIITSAFFFVLLFPLTVNALALKIDESPSGPTQEELNAKFECPFYIGATFGYGSTTWGYLVPPDPSEAMSLSTPLHVSEGGQVWGLFAGYEFMPYFALETSYTHFPNARIDFDPWSILTYENQGLKQIISHTNSISIVGKFMVIIPKSSIRAYSTAGAAGVHRSDEVNDSWNVSPDFGVGLNYNINKHLMVEAGIEYTAGNAVSELNPAESFIPFLYSGHLRLAFRM